jgi:predicted enzyme related to lactoylglutathione lyase
MPNAFVHTELNTTDLEKAKTFYGKLFDWTLQDVQMGDFPYTLISVDGKTAGGMLTNPMQGAPSFWLSYVLVDDVAAMTQKAKSLGAKVVRDVTEVPETGWFSILQDPTGAAIALWKAKPRT